MTHAHLGTSGQPDTTYRRSLAKSSVITQTTTSLLSHQLPQSHVDPSFPQVINIPRRSFLQTLAFRVPYTYPPTFGAFNISLERHSIADLRLVPQRQSMGMGAGP